MWPRSSSLLLAASIIQVVFASLPVSSEDSPAVQLDNGTFVGTSDGSVDKFLGIPFAKPPYVHVFFRLLFQVSLADELFLLYSVGDLRLRLPVASDAYSGIYNASAFGPACPQLNSSALLNISVLPPETLLFLVENTTVAPVGDGEEDCKGSFS